MNFKLLVRSIKAGVLTILGTTLFLAIVGVIINYGTDLIETYQINPYLAIIGFLLSMIGGIVGLVYYLTH